MSGESEMVSRIIMYRQRDGNNLNIKKNHIYRAKYAVHACIIIYVLEYHLLSHTV